LRPAVTVADLVVQNRARTGREADAVLLPLVRVAAEDPLAGRVVLQLLLPGVVRLAGRIRWLFGEDAGPAAVAATWERIRTYPVDRRPCAVAANVLLDARKALWRCRTAVPTDPVDPVVLAGGRPSRPGAVRATGHGPGEPPIPVGAGAAVAGPAGAAGMHPSAEVIALLTAARDADVLDAEAVELLARRYLADETADELAVRHRTHPDTVRRHWRRAEAKLRAAAVA
jgi:hypothetical protein